MIALALLFASLSAGCMSKRQFRAQADHESYSLIADKTQDAQWATPPFSIEPPAESRNHDPYDPECGPLPPDDPAAIAHSLGDLWRAHRAGTLDRIKAHDVERFSRPALAARLNELMLK